MSEKRGHHRPFPPHPEPVGRHTHRRNRVKLPKATPETTVGTITYAEIHSMTSSQRGRGREQCVAEGHHEWTKLENKWGRWPVCRRCGQWSRG